MALIMKICFFQMCHESLLPNPIFMSIKNMQNIFFFLYDDVYLCSDPLSGNMSFIICHVYNLSIINNYNLFSVQLSWGMLKSSWNTCWSKHVSYSASPHFLASTITHVSIATGWTLGQTLVTACALCNRCRWDPGITSDASRTCAFGWTKNNE